MLQSMGSQRVGHDLATEQRLADFKNRKIILEYPSGLKGLYKWKREAEWRTRETEHEKDSAQCPGFEEGGRGQGKWGCLGGQRGKDTDSSLDPPESIWILSQ